MKRAVRCQPVANDAGAIVVLVAAAILGLLGVIGLAIDLGNAYGVKAQLQAAADASALAGANSIFPASSSTLISTSPDPQFFQATRVTDTFAKESKVAGVKLTDQEIVEIKTGYWDLSRDQPADDLQQTVTPPAGKCSENGKGCDSNADCSEACMIQKIPALRVTVRKSVTTFFAKFVGMTELNPEASAIAAIGYSKTARGIFPVAIGKTMVDQYFGQNPLPSPPPLATIKLPYGGSAGSSTAYGQWTSLATDKNDNQTMKDLMDASLKEAPEGTASLPGMKLGDGIWIQPGAKSDLFPYIATNFKDRVVELPVVRDNQLPNNGTAAIIGFVYFRISGASAPDQIFGQFEAYYKDGDQNSSGGPGGPKYNAIAHPLLVK